MANNKVQLADGTTLIDLTEDTVTPETMILGTTAHAANGETITGVVELANAGTNTPLVDSGEGSVGTATAYAREDHVHPSELQSLGTAAYTDSTDYIPASSKGSVSGVAELDSTGKVPSSQLPSYVDDVLEYTSKSSFPSTGETGKIYVDTGTNLTYRWGGSSYVEISPSLALGTISSTAFRGDYGNAAYAHAVTNKGSAFASGLYKITTNAEGHVTAATAVVKSDITALGIPSSDTTYSEATTTTAGLLSAADKTTINALKNLATLEYVEVT